MATQDSEQTHPRAASPAVPLDCLVSVLRARRVIATGAREEVRKSVLVNPDRAEQERLHGSNRIGEADSQLIEVSLEAREGKGQRGRAGDQHDVEAYSRPCLD